MFFILIIQSILINFILGLDASAFAYSIFFAVTLGLSYVDIKERIVPDKAHFLLIFIGILLLIFSTRDISLTDRLIGIFIVSVPMLLITLLTGGFGGGDIKLFAVCGFALGKGTILTSAFFAVIIAALVGVFLIIFFKMNRKTAIPFVPFIHLGMLIAVLAFYQSPNSP